jgi:hypothetical protein
MGLMGNKPTAEFSRLPKLGFFLATKDQFILNIKEVLATMSNTFEDIFTDLIKICSDYLEREVYIVPNLKHAFIRVNFMLILGNCSFNSFN